MAKIIQIRKKDGSIVPFEAQKLEKSLENALFSARAKNGKIAKKLSAQVTDTIEKHFPKGVLPTVKDVQDVIIEVLQKARLPQVAKAYTEHRKVHKEAVGFRTIYGVRDDLGMSTNAIIVLAKRYLLRNEQGAIIETPSRLFRRVAKALAQIEAMYGRSVKKTEEEFYDIMSSLSFLPNTPTLMNAGTPLGQLSACFALPVEDDLRSIFHTLENAMIIHQCLVPETLVMTHNGLVPLGSVNNGDTIATDDGAFLVQQRHNNGFKPTYTLRTTHGYEITGTNEHRLLVVSEEGKLEWKRIGELSAGDWLALAPGKWIGTRTALPKFAFTQKPGRNQTSYKARTYLLPTELTPALAELIGIYLGDGSNHRDGIRFTVSEKEKDLVQRIMHLVDTVFSRHVTVSRAKHETYEVAVLSRQIKEWLAFLGVQKPDSNRASIPRIILQSTAENVCAFLRGLFSTDGCIRENGHVTYTSASLQIINELQTLLLHQGIPTRRYQNKATKIYQLSVCSREGFVNFKDKIGFSSAFKQARLNKIAPEQIFKRGEHIPHQKLIIREWFKALRKEEKSAIRPVIVSMVSNQEFEAAKHQLLQLQKSPAYAHLKRDLISLDFFYTQVASVTPAGLREVVDLTVPFKHAYIANGFVSHNSGGGTGFSFGRLRPKGDMVRSTQGVASGPLSFITIYDKATEVIKQGGKRRGANMGIMPIEHPDIEEFINAKRREGMLANFNVSVSVTDRFMQAAAKNAEFELVNPRNKKAVKKLPAKELWNQLVNAAWECGDPGIIFIDEINRRQPTPQVGAIESTNPCGEVPLLPYEPCNLGSINMAKMVKNGKIHWEKLKNTVRTATHLLDNVIDANKWPMQEVEQIAKANRKIGLGIMGWAECLARCGTRYDSDRALELAEKTAKFIQDESRKKSAELGQERGSFPNLPRSIYAKKHKFLRNATTTTIAPTGSISIIANCTSGIEPFFAVSFVRDVMGGTKLLEVNPYFEQLAKERGFYTKQLMVKIAKSGSIQKVTGIPADVKRVFVTSFDIKPEWHVKMQAAFQKFTDNAVSKTVNLPTSAKQADVDKTYQLAYKLKCKGITIFRYGSKKEQVLYVGKLAPEHITVEEEFAGGCPSEVCPF